MAYILSPTRWSSPSYSAVESFVQAWEKSGHLRRMKEPRLLSTFSMARPIRGARFARRRILVPMMGPMWNVLATASLLGRPSVFAWDVWGDQGAEWKRNLDRYRVEVVLVTSTDAVGVLRAAGYQGALVRTYEAIDVAKYSSGSPLVSRPITILELGRRHADWNASARRYALRSGAVHLFEHDPGTPLFSSDSEFRRRLSDSAISVCFPRSITHPRLAGGVEALTQRYLESFAAGCLVVGSSPKDLSKLFGYDPVVSVDWSNPLAQLARLVDELDMYQDLVDRNRRRVTEVGNWATRVEELSTAWPPRS